MSSISSSSSNDIANRSSSIISSGVADEGSNGSSNAEIDIESMKHLMCLDMVSDLRMEPSIAKVYNDTVKINDNCSNFITYKERLKNFIAMYYNPLECIFNDSQKYPDYMSINFTENNMNKKYVEFQRKFK